MGVHLDMNMQLHILLVEISIQIKHQQNYL